MNSILIGLNSIFKQLVALICNLFIGLFEWLVPRFLIAKDVSKDVVLITGAGSGLGRQIALEFSRQGSSLVLWDINKEGLAETKNLVEKEYEKLKDKDEESGSRICSMYVVDVSNKDIVKRMAAQVYQDLNNDRQIGSDKPERYVSVLVNNAGIYYGSMLLDLTEEQIERIFKINILSHFWTVRAFLPKMIEHEKGHIVEIASQGGLIGMFKQVDYCSTKFANVGFEESLSIELDYMGLRNKVHTTVVCPFFFASNLFTGLDSSVTQLMTPEYVAREAVLTMRCNHSRIILPKFKGYIQYLGKPFLTRRAQLDIIWAENMDKGLKNIKGQVADM